MKKKPSYFSFSVVFPSKSRSYTYRIQKSHLMTTCISVGIVALTLIFGFYFSFNSGVRNFRYKELEKNVVTQQASLESLSKQISQMKISVEQVLDKEEEMKLMLGEMPIKSSKSRRKRRSKKKIKALNSDYKKIQQESPSLNELQQELALLEKYLNETVTTFDRLLSKSKQYKERFSSTPSIRPLYGRVMSKYGWRKHPVFGNRRFHKGIDIAAWTGAPIQATADGIVEYSGWSGGFGYVIVLDHHFGYKTIYAHCSQLLVKKNKVVKKGEVIAQVGSTGISTGPHLHYEIRKWRKAIDPLPYFDLDLFTAIADIW